MPEAGADNRGIMYKLEKSVRMSYYFCANLFNNQEINVLIFILR